MMIWTAERNVDQGALVATLYEQAASVPCERKAVLAGGLRGADTASALTQAGIDTSCYLTISIDAILVQMAGRGLIPHVAGLTPLEAADLVHVEAQFVAKRLGMRAVAEGRNVIWDVSMASQPAVGSWVAAHRQAGYTIRVIFAEISIEESVRRSEAMHRRGHDEYRQGRGYGGRFVPAGAIRALALPHALLPGGAEDAGGVPPIPVQVTSGEPVSAGGVTGMIRSYMSGVLTLDALCWRFWRRRWVAVPPVCPAGLEAAAAAIDDPEPYVPGSFDEVVRAYDLGWITDPDYEALAAAAAAGLRRHTAEGSESPGS